ncbi:hypothetical protein [Pseudomonas atacamensis]
MRSLLSGAASPRQLRCFAFAFAFAFAFDFDFVGASLLANAAWQPPISL